MKIRVVGTQYKNFGSHKFGNFRIVGPSNFICKNKFNSLLWKKTPGARFLLNKNNIQQFFLIQFQNRPIQTYSSAIIWEPDHIIQNGCPFWYQSPRPFKKNNMAMLAPNYPSNFINVNDLDLDKFLDNVDDIWLPCSLVGQAFVMSTFPI